MKARYWVLLSICLVLLLAGCGVKPDSGRWSGQTKGLIMTGVGQFVGVYVQFDVTADQKSIHNLYVKTGGGAVAAHNVPGEFYIAGDGTFSAEESGGDNVLSLTGEFTDAKIAQIVITIQKLQGQNISLSNGSVELSLEK